MRIALSFFVVPLLLFAHVASGQQMYRWMDERGQWVYSNFVPAGVKAEKMGTGDPAPQSASQPSPPATNEKKKAEAKSDRPSQSASDADPTGSAGRRLLVFPPADTGKPLSEWIPVESFATIEECDRARALQIAGSTTLASQSSRGRLPDLNSRCITVAEYKTSKEADVMVAITRVTYDPAGFSTPVIYGRVFNRGQTPARDVAVRYQVRDPQGTIYAEGAIPTTPRDIAPNMFAEFRGPIVGSPGVSDRRIHTEANWSKD